MTAFRRLSIEGFAKPAERPDAGAVPVLQWIALEDLVVDPAYQRDIRGEGRRNVAKIAGAFRWPSFAPVVVSPVEGGRFAIVDGQHRSTAAALIGIEKVPCLVIIATREEQAKAFKAINGMVTKMSRQALHVAALAAGDARAVEIDGVCREAGVEILRYPVQTDQQQPGQTMAVGCLDDCLRAFGRDVLLRALQAVTHSTFPVVTPGLLVAPMIRGLCEFIAAQPECDDAALRALNLDRVLDEARLAPKPKGTTAANVIARLLDDRLAPPAVPSDGAAPAEPEPEQAPAPAPKPRAARERVETEVVLTQAIFDRAGIQIHADEERKNFFLCVAAGNVKIRAVEARLIIGLVRASGAPVDFKFLIGKVWPQGAPIDARNKLDALAQALDEKVAPLGLRAVLVKGVGWQIRGGL